MLLSYRYLHLNQMKLVLATALAVAGIFQLAVIQKVSGGGGGKNNDAGSSRTSYQYDHLQRLVASIEVANGGRGQKIVTQYFYSDIR